jgi:hypothetical protein
LRDQIDALAHSWADSRGVSVVSVAVDGSEATIELAGTVAPDVTDLVREIDEQVDDVSVRVFFVERLDITTTTTTTTVPVSTTPETTPITAPI